MSLSKGTGVVRGEAGDGGSVYASGTSSASYQLALLFEDCIIGWPPRLLCGFLGDSSVLSFTVTSIYSGIFIDCLVVKQLNLTCE